MDATRPYTSSVCAICLQDNTLTQAPRDSSDTPKVINVGLCYPAVPVSSQKHIHKLQRCVHSSMYSSYSGVITSKQFLGRPQHCLANDSWNLEAAWGWAACKAIWML